MSNGFIQHLDFIYFIYGLAFAILTVFASLPGRDFPEARRLPWLWLAAFAAVHGAHEWIEMFLLWMGTPETVVIRVALLAISFTILLEFGRRANGLSRALLWIAVAVVLVPVALCAANNRWADCEVIVRLLFGSVGAWLASAGLWRAARAQDETAPVPLKAGAAVLVLYGFSVGLVPPDEFSSVWNTTRWTALTGIPIQLVRAVCVLALAAAIMRYGFLHAPRCVTNASEHYPRRLQATLIALALVVGATWLGADYAGGRASAHLRNSLMERATAIAHLLDRDRLIALLESPHDQTDPVVRAVEEQLTRAKQALPDVEQIYLYAMKGHDFVFYVCSKSADPQVQIGPGELYAGDLSDADYALFNEARPFVAGPFTDRWGTWVSAAVPALLDARAHPPVRLALGVDISAETFYQAWRGARLAVIGAGALLALLILDFYSRHHRLGVAALRLAESEGLLRRLSEDLERRVEQRTRELAAANAALQTEINGHREAEAKYRALTEQVPAITYRVELLPEPRTTYISPQLWDLLGYEPSAWMADPECWKRALHPDDAARVIAAVREADRTGTPQVIDLRLRANTGAIKWFRIGSRYQFDENGRPVTVHGVMLDITAQVQADARLKETGERYRLLFEHSPAGLFQFDQSFRITEVNTRFAALLSRRREELIGADLAHMATDDLCGSLRTALAGGESYHEGPGGFRGMASDAWIGVRVSPLFGADRTVIGGIAIVEDLSERRRVEEERMRVQKLESLGLLAGGLAHDFNNILTAVLGNISIARQSAPTGSDIRDALQDAERAALRARDLTHQLLTFAKGGVPIKKRHDLAALVREAASFTVRGSASRCVYELAPDTWCAEIDAGQISQAIQNLIINADQAMPNGGTITLRTFNRVLTAGEVAHLPAGRYVEIQVTDTGVGIPDHLRSRIFDPYFTTKSKGTGLGLTMCFSILQKHGGHIGVESETGVGTTVTLLIPAADRPDPEPVSADASPRELSGRERILVMDDERPILALARRTLEKHGYHVLTAESGEEAVRIFDAERTAGRTVDLAILDITVPGGMGGRETLRRLREREPQLSALVSSGYAQDEVMARFKDAGFSGIIPKPYRVEDLLGAVRQALGASRVHT